MGKKNISTIVIGGLNTDIIGLKVNRLLSSGELTFGERIQIGPGGKSRNIAQMMACLAGKNKIAMIGRTSRDPYNLWKLPIAALQKVGVNTKYIKILSFEKSKKFPGIALIPVDKNGQNQIYILPGVNNNFSQQDIDESAPLFKIAKQNSGVLAFALELPLPTAVYAVKKANQYNLKVILDPGGIDEKTDYSQLLNQNIFLIKPNEHEAKILTGITVNSFNRARIAAGKLLQKGIRNVLITAGKNGAYLFNETSQLHVPIPKIKISGNLDETGCGDQTMAALCVFLQEGKNIVDATKLAILAGTLQFHRVGIVPVTKNELYCLKN